MYLPRDERGAVGGKIEAISVSFKSNLRPSNRSRRAQSPDVTTIGARKQRRSRSFGNRIGLERTFIWPRTCSRFRLIRCKRQRCICPILGGANLNEKRASRETDLDRLSRLKVLSWLSPSELKLLARAQIGRAHV